MFIECYKLLRKCITRHLNIVTKVLAVCKVLKACLTETHSIILDCSGYWDANNWDLLYALWPVNQKQFHPTFFILLISLWCDGDRIFAILWLEKMVQNQIAYLESLKYFGLRDGHHLIQNQQRMTNNIYFTVLAISLIANLLTYINSIILSCLKQYLLQDKYHVIFY